MEKERYETKFNYHLVKHFIYLDTEEGKEHKERDLSNGYSSPVKGGVEGEREVIYASSHNRKNIEAKKKKCEKLGDFSFMKTLYYEIIETKED